jgi:ADP-ribose pyrophosphatase YjhB (NUDIX family)
MSLNSNEYDANNPELEKYGGANSEPKTKEVDTFPIHIVSAMIVRNGSVLLGFRINTKVHSNWWSLPVGHREPNESFEQAIKRELTEELGITQVLTTLFDTKVDSEKGIYHRVYLVTSLNNEPNNCEPELCREIGWFGLEQLPDNMTPISRQIVSDYVERQQELVD